MKYSLLVRMKLVSYILAKHDPMHLISEGAPDEEYEHEAARIVLELSEQSERFWYCDRTQILGDIITHCQGIFRTSFSETISETYDWTPIAEEIMAVCQ